MSEQAIAVPPLAYTCTTEGCTAGDCPNCRYVRALDARATAAFDFADELIREAASDGEAFAEKVARDGRSMRGDLHRALAEASEPIVSAPTPGPRE